MWVISQKRLRQFWAAHADAEKPLRLWYRTARKSRWGSLAEVRRTYPHADGVRIERRNGRFLTATVFNIRGNRYQLVTLIFYEIHRIYVETVLTHEAYDKGQWKVNICRD